MKLNTIKVGILSIAIASLFSINVNAQSSNRSLNRQPPTTAELLNMMDANEDGKLSKKEVKGPLKNLFSKIDTDEDGFLNKEELDNAPKLSGKRRQKQQGEAQGKLKGDSQKGQPNTYELIKRMDENEDGKLSMEEVKGRLKENFEKVDTDEDGFISKEELEKAPKPKRR